MIKDFLKGNKSIGKKLDLREMKRLIEQKASELKETLELVSEDPSISSNVKANIIINATSLICGIVAIQPLLFADLFVLSPIQVVMVKYLSNVLEVKTSDTTKQEMLTYIVGTLGFGVLSQQVILGLYKTVIPFAGAITTVPLVYMSTFGLGMACKTLINAKKNNINISKEELKRIRAEEIEKIRKEERDWSIDSLKKQFSEINRKEFKEYKNRLETYDKLINKEKSFSIDDIYDKKEELKKRFSIYKNITIVEKAAYTLSFMKSEEIINVEKIIGQIDRNELILDLSDDKTTYKLKGLAEILISYKNKKYIVEDVQANDGRINRMIDIICPKAEMYHIANREIREYFFDSFEEAKLSLCIASPWMNNYVVNEELIKKMENALNRGVNIRIRYGIVENSYNSQNNSRGENSEKVADKLINRFKGYGSKFKMQKVNSHYKLLICDKSYYIEGSYNFLSFAGEYNDKTKDNREEGATYCTNINMIEHLQKIYFNF